LTARQLCLILKSMEALPIIPATVLSFGVTYYLGKACLAVFMNSLEQSRRAKTESPREIPSRALRSVDSIVG
jgi:hypothetical protein